MDDFGLELHASSHDTINKSFAEDNLPALVPEFNIGAASEKSLSASEFLSKRSCPGADPAGQGQGSVDAAASSSGLDGSPPPEAPRRR
eukprot:12806157-Alexandrium_andersonii.AAC.1